MNVCMVGGSKIHGGFHFSFGVRPRRMIMKMLGVWGRFFLVSLRPS